MIYGGRPGSVPLAGSLPTVGAPIPPANITATDMALDKTTCIGPCLVNVIITWTNQGGSTGSFVAGVSVDGGNPTLQSSPDTLNPTESITHSFTLNLTIGNHTICPVPN